MNNDSNHIDYMRGSIFRFDEKNYSDIAIDLTFRNELILRPYLNHIKTFFENLGYNVDITNYRYIRIIWFNKNTGNSILFNDDTNKYYNAQQALYLGALKLTKFIKKSLNANGIYRWNVINYNECKNFITFVLSKINNKIIKYEMDDEDVITTIIIKRAQKEIGGCPPTYKEAINS